MVSDEVKLFVYSDIQIKSDKEINKKIGRDFKCGDVSIGSKRHKYSKIINYNQCVLNILILRLLLKVNYLL